MTVKTARNSAAIDIRITCGPRQKSRIQVKRTKIIWQHAMAIILWIVSAEREHQWQTYNEACLFGEDVVMGMIP
jgi:hypothetical protein